LASGKGWIQSHRPVRVGRPSRVREHSVVTQGRKRGPSVDSARGQEAGCRIGRSQWQRNQRRRSGRQRALLSSR
jgi:hypothetical protein